MEARYKERERERERDSFNAYLDEKHFYFDVTSEEDFVVDLDFQFRLADELVQACVRTEDLHNHIGGVAHRDANCQFSVAHGRDNLQLVESSDVRLQAWAGRRRPGLLCLSEERPREHAREIVDIATL